MGGIFGRVLSTKKFPSYAKEVRQTINSLPGLSAQLEFLLHNRQFRVDQKKSEFLTFLNKVHDAKPQKILEIGGRRGGSSILLSYAAGEQAQVLTLDLNNSGYRLRSLNSLCDQRPIQFWQGDSHLHSTYQRVEAYLAGHALDVLFIDGDHTYEGAKQDFTNYSRLAKNGGLIALHDIQQDYTTRYQVQTAAWTGGVPDFWQEVKTAGFHVEELIADPYQDGYGIGLVYWDTQHSEQCLSKLR